MENEAEVLVEDRISKITDEVVSNSDFDYDKLLVKTENKYKGVASLSVNTTEVNKIQNKFSDVFKNKMGHLNTQYFTVPVGDLTNISFLASKGPKVTFAYDITGSVDVGIRSEFSSAGVNQTLHKVFMTVDAKVVFVSKIYKDNIIIKNEMELCETVIVGDTPDYLYPKLN